MNDNKFKVGDKVIWQNAKVEIWGKHFEEDKRKYEYAFKDKKNAWNRGIAYESDLSELKKKDKLEVGDKFKCKTSSRIASRINEVLSVVGDEKSNQVKYLVKRIDVVSAEEIDEIIYE
jgi:hypothetical protein